MLQLRWFHATGGKQSLGGKKKEGGGARGDGQWEERREAGQVLLVKENLNGFGWGLDQRSSAYMWEGGAI